MSGKKIGVFQPPGSAPAPDRALIVHAEDRYFEHICSGGCDFFEKVGSAARERGITPLIFRSDDPMGAALFDEPHKHLMVGPRRRKGPNIFHVYPAYVQGYWYLDTQGYFWKSSMLGKTFDPENVDAEAAHAFFNRVSKYRIGHNVSMCKQPPPQPLEPADVAVFTQDIERYRDQLHYIITQRMIRASANAVDGLCYVKPHPLLNAEQRAWLGRVCARLPNIRVVDASIHDIIRASAVVVSQNSAVGFEALMHRKPVITCALTDYAAASLVSRDPAELRANIKAAPAHFARFPFEKYLYWFLGQNMLEPKASDFTDRALRILYG